jgi:hypothetical protein
MVMIDHRQVIQPKNVSISSATLAKLSDGNYEAVVATAAEPKPTASLCTRRRVMCRSRFTCKEITKRFLALTLFIFLSWTIAGAYTIVFHGGKRVQIPDNFIVTSDAVIYETAPGVNVSFRLNSVDVLATERANKEPSGSFLNRIGAQQREAPTTATIPKATRTITNRDLEPYERARIKSEADWEKRRKELGGPSLEETRQEAARRDAALDELIERKKAEAEANYWREREAELRAAMAVRMNATDYQNGQYFWPNGIVPVQSGFGGFDSRFRFNGGFPFRINQGSPCGFNPSASCLLSNPRSLFNQGAFPVRRTIFGINGGRHGVGVFGGPGRRH